MVVGIRISDVAVCGVDSRWVWVFGRFVAIGFSVCAMGVGEGNEGLDIG